MFIYLHNPAHNGDILHSSGIAKMIIKNNPDKKFKLVLSCSTMIFEDTIKQYNNVELLTHPCEWKFSERYNNNEGEEYIKYLHDELIKFYNGNLYLNLWKIMTDNNSDCMDLRNRIEYLKNLFNNIKNLYNIHLNFDVDNYEELIPEIPNLNIDFFNDYIKEKKYDKKIFFYNLNGFSGQESKPKNFNDNFINKLLIRNSNSLIIIPHSSNIKHLNLISLKDDLNIDKELSGKSLIYYANICNNCDDVYFKYNGGSLFILNKRNINNKKINYYYLDNNYEIIKECYKLNCNYSII